MFIFAPIVYQAAVTMSGSRFGVRWSESIALGVLWIGLGSASAPQAPRPVVSFTAVQLDSADPAHRRVGSLTWLGGWHLQSRDPSFGGYSSLATHDGRFMALSIVSVCALVVAAGLVHLRSRQLA